MADSGVAYKDLQQLLDAILSVGSEFSLPVVLRRIVQSAVELVEARYGALGVLDESGTRLAEFITVGLDDDQVRQIGDLPEGHGILGLLIVDPQPIRLEHLSEHPDSFGFPANHPRMDRFLGVPIRVRGEIFGNLYLTDKQGGEPFSERDEELAIGLAAAAGVAIENTRLHARLGDLMVVEDRERIARDLHDTVIQRLFASGLALQSLAARAVDQELAAKLQAAVDDIDDTVRYIRTTIFELQKQRLPGRSLRQEVLDLVSEANTTLGFDPIVQFDGPIDSVVDDALADHAVAVVRECISNVAKHAGARHLEIRLRAANGELCVDVIDDGRGLADSTGGVDRGGGTGHGLPNMRARAARLGGSLTVRPAAQGGTWLTWKVPISAG